MPISVAECVYTIHTVEEYNEVRKTEKDWIVVAGPYILPNEMDLLRAAVIPFEQGRIQFMIVSENKWGNVVNLYRRRPASSPYP